MSQFPYVKTLKDSFRLAFQNYLVFVPVVLSWLAGLAAVPFTWNLNFSTVFSVRTVTLIFFFSVISAIVGYVISGWLYALVKRIIEKKKLNLSGGFLEGLPLAWRKFKVQLLLMFLFLAALLAGVILGLIYFVPFVGKIFLAFVITCAVVLLLAAGFALGFVTPIIILENFGAGESIRQTYRFFMKHKGEAITIGLITIPLFLVALLPLLIFQFQTIFGYYAGQAMQPSLSSSLKWQLLSLPMVLLNVVVIFFYTLAYLKMKKVRKS